MAYTHSKQEKQLGTSVSLATAAVIGNEFMPGYVPHIIRAVAMVFTTAPDDDGVVTIRNRPTAGASTAETTVDTISYGTGDTAGTVKYIDGLDVEIKPGGGLAFEVTDATPTAGNATLVAYVEPRWEQPGNITTMTDAS